MKIVFPFIVFIVGFTLAMYVIGLCEVWDWPFHEFCKGVWQ